MAKKVRPPKRIHKTKTLFKLLGVCTHESDEEYPVIEAIHTYEDMMDFDRLVCAGGLKRYIRPSHDSDLPRDPEKRAELEKHFEPHIRVHEISPGLRTKYFTRMWKL
jgi:hypothetical protein